MILESSQQSDLRTRNEGNYNSGYVLCIDCKNLESYWKNGKVAFFMCKINSVSMRKLESRWKRCRNFTHTNTSALKRRNNIK